MTCTCMQRPPIICSLTAHVIPCYYPINSMLAEYTTVLMLLSPFIDAIKLKHMVLSSWIGRALDVVTGASCVSSAAGDAMIKGSTLLAMHAVLWYFELQTSLMQLVYGANNILHVFFLEPDVLFKVTLCLDFFWQPKGFMG
jgi:hypothetical protein